MDKDSRFSSVKLAKADVDEACTQLLDLYDESAAQAQSGGGVGEVQPAAVGHVTAQSAAAAAPATAAAAAPPASLASALDAKVLLQPCLPTLPSIFLLSFPLLPSRLVVIRLCCFPPVVIPLLCLPLSISICMSLPVSVCV